jgi:hypothetical protein
MALVLDIVILGQTWNRQALPTQLPQLLEHNLSPSVVLFHRAMHFDYLILQLAHVPDAFQIMRKDHHGERTHHRILAEIKESDSSTSVFYPKHLAADALVFAYVPARFRNRNAVCGR